jgi:hypothetical protein
MWQVKVFSGSCDSLESQINQWLSVNQYEEVKISMSEWAVYRLNQGVEGGSSAILLYR